MKFYDTIFKANMSENNQPKLKRIIKLFYWLEIIAAGMLVLLNQLPLTTSSLKIRLSGLFVCLIILSSPTIVILGIIDLFNRPRSKFTIFMVIVNIILIVTALLFWEFTKFILIFAPISLFYGPFQFPGL